MLSFIPTPIGNPQDITIRALKLFEEATLFLCEDTRQTKKLLRILEARFDLSYPILADFLSFNEHNGFKRLEEIGSRIENESVVFVSDAGMPVISDPGQLLVEYAQINKIKYDVLPGANALTTAYASSGFKSGKFLFFAFLPHKGEDRREALIKVLNSSENAIIYESPHRLIKLLEEVVEIEPDRVLFLAKELTKKFQRYYKDNAQNLLDELREVEIKGEWVVIFEGNSNISKSFSYNDILSLDIQPKLKAKLLSKLSDKSVKECYENIIKSTAKIR
ncbi:rRNA small subunit methyltransferase I [hydrothermal vent metagenome]|uniref:rRNA small subunit methyltransferase I n=1 Tax=hydrothermal vent metagenome TaxID=652676 RepID=A0A1W1EJ27_9ZZZZ